MPKGGVVKDGQAGPPVWDLSSIRPKDVSLAMQDIEALVKKVEELRGRLDALSPDSFPSLLKDLEDLKGKSSILAGYAHLRSSEDSSDEEAQALVAKVQQFFVAVENRLLFVNLWFKDLPDAKADAFIRVCPDNRYYLELIRKAKPYTLSEKEERVINLLDASGSSALGQVYSTIISQLEFPYRKRRVDQHELFNLVRDRSPAVRRDAYLSLLTRYAKEKDVLGLLYRNIIISWRDENITLRGFNSPINVRNVQNDIPDGAVESLLRSCERNQAIFHRFFESKRKYLGLKRMTRFDLYAPVESKERKIPYLAATRMILDSFSSFSPMFAEEAKKVIDQGHLHARLQKNKNPGGFCAGLSTKTVPFVLLNYAGTSRDVSTVAHELGHAVHYLLARENTEFSFDACLPLAETASIFGEMLLMEELKKENPAAMKPLLYFRLEDTYASIIRQASFVAFEKEAHALMAEGGTIKEVGDAYIHGLRRQLGSMVDVDERFSHEWLLVPHLFHSPFYCYAYAFGNLLVLALWDRYLKEGRSFVPKMMALLEKGGSESPVAITNAIGVDISSEKFWQQGFDVIKMMVAEIER